MGLDGGGSGAGWERGDDDFCKRERLNKILGTNG